MDIPTNFKRTASDCGFVASVIQAHLNAILRAPPVSIINLQASLLSFNLFLTTTPSFLYTTVNGRFLSFLFIVPNTYLLRKNL